MSLNRTIRRATKAALKAMNSVGEDIKYNQESSAIYDTDKGTVNRTDVPISIKGWFTSFKESQIDGINVQPGDKRLTLSVIDIKFEPSLTDFITDESGQEWEVINIKLPPPKILYILQVRRP